MRAGNEGTRRTFKKLIRPKLGGARLLIGSACTDPAPAERSTWATAPSSTSACDIDTSSGCSSTALLYSVMRAAASSPLSPAANLITSQRLGCGSTAITVAPSTAAYKAKRPWLAPTSTTTGVAFCARVCSMASFMIA